MRNQIKSLLCIALMGVAAALSVRAQTYSNAVMALHPIAYYPLNEVATPPDPVTISITNYGTDTNLTMTTFGDVIYGNSSPLASQPNDSSDYFNGDSYATNNYDTTLSKQPPFTIEGWFLARNISSTTCPTSDFDANSPRSGWLIYMDIANPGQYTFRAYNQNGTTPSLSFNIGAAGSIARDTWYHLAVVVDTNGGTTNVSGYIDGQLVSGPTVLPSYVPNDGLGGGFSAGARSDTGFAFDGNIDELAFYPSALSGATILSHYQAATNPSPATAYDQLVLQQHPLAYYRFNEATPALSSPYPEPLPVAHNYGSLGSAANGYYTPGTLPGGVAGPTNSGFGGLPALELNPSDTASVGTAGPGVFCAPFNPETFNETNGFTVAFWAQVPSAPFYFQTILGRGDGSWRFDVDNPSAFPHWAAAPNGDLTGTTSLADGNWHFWAGVYDPVAGTGSLYIDGAVVTSGAWVALSSSVQYPLLIGGAPDYDNSARNFSGNVAQVAVFSNVLTGAQINSLYTAAGGAPATVSVLITSITANEGSSTNITATAGGNEPLYLQWYSNSGTSTPIPGATNLTLNLTNISAAQSGNQYFIVASNAFGTATSASVTLTVNSGQPVITTDVAPTYTESPVGVTDEFSVAVTGTEPFSYQWMLNSAPISGATNSSYAFTVAAGTNNYSVVVSNSYSTANSSVAQVVGLTTAPPLITFGDGSLWHLNGTAGAAVPTLNNGSLLLTDGNGGEASTAFYVIPQYVDGFVATFTYSVTNGGADGTTFMVQDSSAGTNALGGGGGDLGYYGIGNSVAFELNLYTGANGGEGIAFGSDGATPDSPIALPPYIPPGPLNLDTGDPINVRVALVGGTMYVKLTDTTTGGTYVASHHYGDLQPIMGSTSGYVGFSGATGGVTSIQAVSNFQFTYTTPPVLSLTTSNNNAVIRWPVSVSPMFTLQQASVVTGPYTNITTSPTIVSGENQITVPVTGKSQFFQLILP